MKKPPKKEIKSLEDIRDFFYASQAAIRKHFMKDWPTPQEDLENLRELPNRSREKETAMNTTNKLTITLSPEGVTQP